MLKKVKTEKIEEMEKFDIATVGSLVEDITKVDIALTEVPDIGMREVVIRESGNFLHLRENIINIPVEMIVFPFFTPQKQNRRMNIQYKFEDLGVKMSCTLIARDARDKVFQPSIFEEKIYTYLIAAYEVKEELEDDEEYIEFEISDFIVNFLGNKMNRTYYTKVEQALKNLKNTEYQFEVSNHTKLGKYKFEDEEFKLLTYQKLTKGKKKYYRVTLNKNIRKKIKEKRYVKYNSKTLMEILARDPIASRIYKYISKIRYEKQDGTINVRTLAAIIPLKTEQITERQNKSGETKLYKLCRMKQVVKRIEKAYELLKELGYIEKYEVKINEKEEKYYIYYKFNIEKDGTCHVSSFIGNKNKVKEIGYAKQEAGITTEIVEERNHYGNIEEAEIITVDTTEKVKKVSVVKKEEQNFSEKIKSSITKAKKNVYVSKAWSKKVDNKLKTVLTEYGEEILVEVLNSLSKSLVTTIKTTLSQYINGIVKNIVNGKQNETTKNKIKANPKQNLTLFGENKEETNTENIQKSNTMKTEIKKPIKLQELIETTEDEKDILEIFNAYDEYEKMKIEEKALQKMTEENKDLSIKFLMEMKKRTKNVYLSMIQSALKKSIKEYEEEKSKNS